MLACCDLWCYPPSELFLFFVLLFHFSQNRNRTNHNRISFPPRPQEIVRRHRVGAAPVDCGGSGGKESGWSWRTPAVGSGQPCPVPTLPQAFDMNRGIPAVVGEERSQLSPFFGARESFRIWVSLRWWRDQVCSVILMPYRDFSRWCSSAV